tara:strand:- start:1788 stop:2156 length:369 start_codon:yes stop_codon:yes gene_type:complete
MKKLLTALIFTLATSVWAGDFDNGVAATAKGDFTTAASFFRKAAERGMPEAQVKLGFYYAFGMGVSKDFLQAHMWMNLAAVSGDKGAPKARDTIVAKMTSQQITKAQAMAKKCLANNYKDCE